MSDEDTQSAASSLLDPIKRSFTAVFNELNAATEARIDQAKLHTTGRDRYARYIAAKVGRFPLFGTTRQVQVQDVYIRVAFSSDIESLRYKPRHAIERSLYQQKWGHADTRRLQETLLAPVDALNRTDEGFALLGAPGSGKSTAFRHIAVLAANGQRIRGKRRIPVFLAAREMLKGYLGIAAACAKYFADLSFEMSDRLVHTLASSGSLLLLLDGIDETSSGHRGLLIEELAALRTRFPEAIFCVSARPYSLASGLHGFSKWETLPLNLDERFQFIDRWFASVDPEKGKRLSMACRERPAILDLGSSPLLLSIVCALYFNDLEVPEEPDELYDRALHGLLGQWDAFRNIARVSSLSELSLSKRFLLASEIAASLFDRGQIVFTVEEIASTQAIKRCQERFQVDELDPENVVHSLCNDFGLLSERSPGEFSFSHLTFQEFLTAKYIVGNRTDMNLVSEFRKSVRWAEVVQLVAKLLPNPDNFIDALHSVARLGTGAHVITLINVWALSPVCAPEIRRKVMHGIAMKLAGILKRLGDATFDIQGRELTIYCKRHNSLSQLRTLHMRRIQARFESDSDESTDLVRAQFRAVLPVSSDDDVLAGTLHNILNLLMLSRLSLATLGVEEVALFRVWDSAGRPVLTTFSYRDPHTRIK